MRQRECKPSAKAKFILVLLRRSLTSPQNAATLVQAERKSKIYFGFVETQPLPQHRKESQRGCKEDEKRKNPTFKIEVRFFPLNNVELRREKSYLCPCKLKRTRALLRSNSPAIDLPRYTITQEGWQMIARPLVIGNVPMAKKTFSHNWQYKKTKGRPKSPGDQLILYCKCINS